MDLNADSHGRAFQLLGAKLEEVFPRLLGIPLRLARWESLLQSWKELKPLPSLHDLATFRLESADRVSCIEGDIRELLQRTDTIFQYIPRESMGLKNRTLDVGDVAAMPERRLGEAASGSWVLKCGEGADGGYRGRGKRRRVGLFHHQKRLSIIIISRIW